MIISGPTYIDGEIVSRYISIDEGKISSVERALKTTEEIFYWDGVILPSGTDIHVHFRDPGQTHKEDFYTGTRSAACGGITTVADMPNNDPPIDSYGRLKEKFKISSKKACTDYALYGLLSTNTEKMMELTRLFKVYLAGSTGVEKVTDLKDEANTVLDSDGFLAFHCEDEELFKGKGEDLVGYNKERPSLSEVKAIESLATWPEGKKHVCHVSTDAGFKAAKSLGYSVEVTPHHLYFTDEVILGPFGKVNPPLRGDKDHFALTEHFERDEIDVLASDHAPHTESEKMVDFSEAPAGLPGVETMYPLMMNSVAMGETALSTVVDMISTKPSEILGIKKGKIKEGFFADLALFDFREVENIMNERLHSKCGWSPFEGFRAIFPRHVFCRGEFLVKNREFIGSKGEGKNISLL